LPMKWDKWRQKRKSQMFHDSSCESNDSSWESEKHRPQNWMDTQEC
jgi:hypothetical protein